MVLSLNTTTIPKKDWEAYLTNFFNEARSRKSEKDVENVIVKGTLFSHQIDFIKNLDVNVQESKRIRPGFYHCTFEI